MNVLKAEEFSSTRKLLMFVKNNNIQRENILTITAVQEAPALYTIFYYGDSEVKDETPGFWD